RCVQPLVCVAGTQDRVRTEVELGPEGVFRLTYRFEVRVDAKVRRVIRRHTEVGVNQSVGQHIFLGVSEYVRHRSQQRCPVIVEDVSTERSSGKLILKAVKELAVVSEDLDLAVAENVPRKAQS